MLHNFEGKEGGYGKNETFMEIESDTNFKESQTPLI